MEEFTPEQVPSNGRNPAERLEHLKVLHELSQETGFVQTAELIELRMNVSEWQEKAQQLVEDLSKGDFVTGMRLNIGYNLALASIYYEMDERDLYFDCIDEALENAQQIKFDDLAEKIEQLG